MTTQRESKHRNYVAKYAHKLNKAVIIPSKKQKQERSRRERNKART